MYLNKKLISVIVLALVLALSLSFTGCSGNSQTPDNSGDTTTDGTTANEEGPTVALLLPSLTGNVYLSQAYGFIDEAEKLGWPRPIVLAAGGYDKIDVQVKQVEDMIAAGIDAIAIAPLSAEGLTPVVDKACDAGVTVLHFGQATNSTKVKVTIHSDQIEIGKKLAKSIGDSLNGEGNVVMFCGPTGATWSQLEYDGFMSVIKSDYPKINILAEKWTVYDAGVAMNTMNDLLQAFDNIDFIYTSYDTYAEGAARALEIAGVKIKMNTASLSPKTFEMLKNGTLEYVVGTGMVAEGRMSIQAIDKMLKGEEVPAEQFTPSIDYWAKDVQANPDGYDTSAEYYPDGWTLPN